MRNCPVALLALLLALPVSAQESQDRPSRPPDFQGVLDDNDAVREGKPADTHTFDVRQGTEVTVTMTASDFDTYLVVRSPTGQEWTNDDFGDTRTSQVTISPAAPGTYSIVATAYTAEGRGAYQVHVRTVSANVVSTVSGRLDYQDAQQIKGEFYDELALRPPTSGEFYVDLLALGFSGYLRVTSPSGVRTSGQQQYGPETPIRVGPFRGERGTWTVDVTTQGPGQVGAYDVRVITLDPQQ
ncbi:MAG TPA: PPC domain-containing protein [Rubricoccaceae bacterium]|jgi:hypothetical protein